MAHAFVMTVHNASPKIAAMFDRAIHFDRATQTMVERKILDPPFRLEHVMKATSLQDRVSWSVLGTIRASLILWYGQLILWFSFSGMFAYGRFINGCSFCWLSGT